MPWIDIAALNDPRLAVYRQLKQSNLTRWSGWFIAEGEKLTDRLLRSRYAVESLLVDQKQAARYVERLPPETPLYVVAEGLVEQVIGFNFHRGVLACGRRGPVATSWRPDGGPGRRTIVVCPQIHDPSNLGSLIRTSCALGIDALVLGPGSADPLSRRTLRVSMGAALELPLVEAADLAAELEHLRQQCGFELLATVVDPAAERLELASRGERLAILLGCEGHGLSADWIARCQRRVTIPMHRQTDSLNLSVAAGIVLHHLMGERAFSNSGGACI